MAVKQLKVSPSAGQQELIDILAAGWGMAEAAVVMEGFSKGMPHLMDEYEQFQRIKGVPESPLRSLLIRLASNAAIADHELSEVAYQCDMPVELLKAIRDCLKKEGAAENVRSS